MYGRSGPIGAAGLIALLAAQPVAAQQAAVPDAEPALDTGAPLADMPDIGVDWPELAADPQSGAQARATPLAEVRYGWRIDGLEGIGSPLLRSRFAALSVLDQNDEEPANAAQIDRRAREDAAALVTLLRAEGYYDAEVEPRIETAEGRPTVVLSASPGPIYRLKDVTIAGVEAAGDKAAALREAFGVNAQDPVNADAIAAGEAKLRLEVGEQGFPFATIGDPVVTIDREARTATLDVAVDPGTARVFGQIRTNVGNRVFGADHVQEIARFTPGQPYYEPALADLRRALVQTGFTSARETRPVWTSARRKSASAGS
jgi:translocation and assembly module TamA